MQTNNIEKSLEMEIVRMQPLTYPKVNDERPITRRITLLASSVGQVSNFKAKSESFDVNHQ
jgi:hypothetical protein